MYNKKLILVIESRFISNKFAETLEQAGYLVLSANDLETAQKILVNRKPSLIICSESVDKSETLEICRQLRSENTDNLPPLCLLGSEKSHSNQTKLRLQTGAEQYFSIPFEPLEFIRIVTVLIEGRTSKDSLEQQDLVFRSLIENITDIITVLTMDGKILYESPSVQNILGRKPVDSLGTNAFDLIHPDDRQKVLNYINTANRETAVKGIEYRIKHADGSWKIFHSIGRFNKSIFKTKTILINSRDVTERNLLNERHHLALEKAKMVWWEWIPATDTVTTSDNFAEIYGTNKPNDSSEGIKLIHPDDIKPHRKLVRSISKGGGSYHSEFRVIRQNDGKTIWLEETAAAILNEQKNVERVVGIAVDISERKKAEKDLRESEEKFKAFFKGIPIPVYVWEKHEAGDDFVLIDSNDAGDQQTTSFSSRYFGMKSSELLDDEPEMMNGLRRCMDEENVVHIESEYHHQETKELKILDLYFVCISPTMVMVVSRDITQTKFAEAERAELLAQIELQNQRLNDIIESIPGAVWETRIYDSITHQQTGFVSEYIEKMTGYSKEEWLSHPNFWLDIVHPDDKEQAIEKSNAFLNEKGEGFLEYRFIAKSGEIIWTETQMKSVRNQKGEIVNLTGITIDISQRKKAEEALLRSEERLRLSQRLESIGKLAGGIAHDFNNMLTAINGYSELLLRELKKEDSIRAKVLEIKKAGERSAQLTQQLLAFSRRQILKPQKIDLNYIINDMSNLLSRLIGEHISLEIELNEDECRVEADPGQLSQVIMNLVVNARDAMPKGGDLKIKTENVTLDQEYADKYVPTIPGDYVLLIVSDTGTGVGDKDIKHIFDPFYTTKPKGSGTGLGLSTVYGIVKQSGGYIWVNSEPDQGAVFKIFLPQIKDKIKVLAKEVETETNLYGGETILLVEDEKPVRDLTADILKIYGYNVIEANDGLEALELFNDTPEKISLLVTDVLMPRMNGRELVERILKIDSEVKILFSSGFSEDREMMHGVSEFDMDIINKPFTPEELVKKVRQLLDGKK